MDSASGLFRSKIEDFTTKRGSRQNCISYFDHITNVVEFVLKKQNLVPTQFSMVGNYILSWVLPSLSSVKFQNKKIFF